jgi:nucleotide-binding universal stress UspA family protein
MGGVSSEMENYTTAVGDFKRARERAALQEILARLTGKSTELLSYEDVRHKLRARGVASRGLRDIPLDAIVGSVGRYHDFTRNFLPKQDSDQDRWARVHLATHDLAGLPPIELYQIGEAYFVHDGHHRVSVARQLGAKEIQAYVTEIRSRVPLTADTRPEELILKAEYVNFLEHTRLAELRPEADYGVNLTVTCVGRYEQIIQHIDVHRYYMGIEQQREIPYEEAVTSWFDLVYLPIVESMRELGILREFPDRTEADLYLWISKRRADIEDELGWEVPYSAVAVDLAEQEGARRPRLAARVGKRVLEIVIADDTKKEKQTGAGRREKVDEETASRMFQDVLVAVSGDESSWVALEQAIKVAQKEAGRLFGLYVVSREEEKDDERAQEIRNRFLWRCGEFGIDSRFAIAVGPVGQKICERARWTDLVAVNLAHPPQDSAFSRLASGFRNLINRCSRPVLAVPGITTDLAYPLLAYDGSPKSKEALYVATYLSGQWLAPLVVVTVVEEGVTADHLEAARAYLGEHGVSAEYELADGPVPDAILSTAVRHDRDFIIMGGYGGNALKDVVLGTAVDVIMNQVKIPMFICR